MLSSVSSKVAVRKYLFQEMTSVKFRSYSQHGLGNTPVYSGDVVLRGTSADMGLDTGATLPPFVSLAIHKRIGYCTANDLTTVVPLSQLGTGAMRISGLTDTVLYGPSSPNRIGSLELSQWTARAESLRLITAGGQTWQMVLVGLVGNDGMPLVDGAGNPTWTASIVTGLEVNRFVTSDVKRRVRDTGDLSMPS